MCAGVWERERGDKSCVSIIAAASGKQRKREGKRQEGEIVYVCAVQMYGWRVRTIKRRYKLPTARLLFILIRIYVKPCLSSIL